MTALVVIGVIVLVILLVLQVRIGLAAEYSQEGFVLTAKLGFFTYQIIPAREKVESPGKIARREEKERKKAEKEARKQQEKTETKAPSARKKGGTMELVKQFLPLICEALGALKRRIRIDNLTVHYTVAGGEDAAAAAMTYGTLSGVDGVIVGLLENNFQVKRRQITTSVDFLAEKGSIYLFAKISIKIGQILYLAVHYALASYRVWKGKDKTTQAQTTAQSSSAPKKEKAV